MAKAPEVQVVQAGVGRNLIARSSRISSSLVNLIWERLISAFSRIAAGANAVVDGSA